MGVDDGRMPGDVWSELSETIEAAGERPGRTQLPEKVWVGLTGRHVITMTESALWVATRPWRLTRRSRAGNITRFPLTEVTGLKIRLHFVWIALLLHRPLPRRPLVSLRLGRGKFGRLWGVDPGPR